MNAEINRRAFGFAEVAEMFGISVDSVKRLWRSGELATITIGGRRLIPANEIERVAREGVGKPRTPRAQVANKSDRAK